MERRTGNGGAVFRAPQEEFRSPAVVILADATVIPCAGPRESMLITLAPFKDHGRPAFIGSTIRSRSVFQEAAGNLNEDESQRLNNLLSRTMDGFLDEGVVRSNAVFRSETPGKPDIHVLVSGDPFKQSSLRLYCHIAEYNGARVLIQDARGTKRDADKIEKTLRREGNYHFPSGWDNKTN